MKVLRFLAWIAAAVVVLAALTLILAIASNWQDVPPSAEFLRLNRLIRERPQVPDRDNAFVYLLGIRAPAGMDPQALGERRAAWLESLDRDIGRLKDDPLLEPLEYSDQRSEPVKLFTKACDADEPHACAATFDSLPGPESWSDADRLLLERYRALIGRRAWREHVGNDISQPLPTLADLTAGQRLQMLALRGADAVPLRDALSDDLAFWRAMLASSDLVISKLVAVAGLRQHFQFGSLLMRHVVAADRAAAIPAGWRIELTRDELAFERPLASELVLMQKVWRMTNLVDAESKPRRIPFYQPQDVENELAAEYVEVATAFDVPLTDYPRVVQLLARRPPRHPFPSRLYDIGGDYLRQLGATNYWAYPPRIAAVEAWRRAALATAALRARGVQPVAMAAELAKVPLRNPFSGAPFAWSESEQAVIYEGTEHQKAGRRRQTYPY